MPIDLLKTYPADETKTWKAGKAAGNTQNNDPTLIEPVQNDEAGFMLPLFG